MLRFSIKSLYIPSSIATVPEDNPGVIALAPIKKPLITNFMLEQSSPKSNN